MAVKAKELRYEVEVAGLEPAACEADWTPEHFVLAGLVRCSLASFRHAATRRGLAGDGSGRAAGVVTRRESDGLYAFVGIEVELDVALDPAPAEGLAELVEHAQRGCFVGNSLTAKPAYRWIVNGEPAT